MERNSKTIVIGLDALPWAYLEPLLKRGSVPNLSSLISKGCKGVLKSTKPPTSPVAWSSFMTGVNPQKHKIFDFVAMKHGSYETQTVDGRDREEVGFWKYLNSGGIKCGICNLALSFPAEEVDGFFISGFDSPKYSPDIIYPKKIYERLKYKSGETPFPYPNFMMRGGDNKDRIENYIKQCLNREDIQTEIVLNLSEEYEVDVLVTNYMAIDHFNHYLDDIEYIFRAIERLDYNVGEFIKKYPDENFIVISDHGSQRLDRVILAYEWLKDMGYIVFDNKRYKSRLINAVIANLLQDRLGVKGYIEKALRNSISPILQTMPNIIQDKLIDLLSGSDSINFWPQDLVDTNKSVISNFLPGINGFRLNLKGREPNGIVDPVDYHEVREGIIEKLESLRDPVSEKLLFKEVMRREELCDDIDEDVLPDIIGISNEEARCKLVASLSSRRSILESHFVSTCKDAKYFGEHISEGICIFSGPAFKRNYECSSHNLMDITALILYLHDIPLPKSFDALVPLDVISSKLDKKQITYQETIPVKGNLLKRELDEDDRKDIEQRLKGLGYL